MRSRKKTYNWTPDIVVKSYSVMGINEIMRRSGDSCYYICKCLRRAGVTMRPFHGEIKAISIKTDSTPVEKAYIAGILDGEGMIGIYDRRTPGSRNRILVDIANTCKPLIDWIFTKMDGGRLANKSPKLSGKAKKVLYNWRITRVRDVELFLDMLLPYLIVKRDKAEQALNIIKKGGQK